MSYSRSVERLGPAFALSVLPAAAGQLAMVASVLAAGQQRFLGGPVALAAFVTAWAVAALLIARTLRKRWTGSSRHTTVSFLIASLGGFAAGALSLALTSQWQDLMSEPYPTGAMVVLDLVATLAPFAAGVACAWVVLALTEGEAPWSRLRP